jgi:Caudovirus prohead serine protease
MSTFKSLDFPVSSINFKAGDGEEAGTFEAVVAVFDKVDRHREVFDHGFFTESLKAGLPAVVWSHAWMTPPIGITHEAAETDEGLRAKGRFFVRDEEQCPLAKHVYTAMSVKGGDGRPSLREWSVGANVSKESYEDHPDLGRIVHLEEGEAVEYGPCLKGINADTRTVALKADIKQALTSGSLPIPELLEVLQELQYERTDLKAALPVSNLDFAAREKPFDSAAARRRIKAWAESDGEINFTNYAKAFLWVDDGDGAKTNVTAYRFVVADVVDGELKYVPKAIFAAAAVMQGARGGTTVGNAGEVAIKKSLDQLYGRMRSEFDDDSIVAPWKRKAQSGPRSNGEISDEHARVLADVLF